MNIARLRQSLQGETPEERFLDFCQQLRQPGALLDLLKLYPSLGRLLAEAVERHVAFYEEVLQHLCADWQEICSTFTPQHDPGLVVNIEGGLGDTHRGGRSVIKLTCESGFQIIYKPRSLQVDLHFQEVLRWLNARGWSPAFQPLTLLDKCTHGWSEYVTARSCTSREELARFYERQGGYLGLLYSLDATDLHFENLIASGEHPFIIDLESLFQPRLRKGPVLPQVSQVSTDVLAQSVLRMGLLPVRTAFNRDMEGVDISGLGGKEGQLTPFPVIQWEGVGTDQMHMTRQRIPIPGQQNLPTLNGAAVDILEYREALMAGFTRIYRLLMEHREAFVDGPLARFDHDEIRIIVRDTRRYGELLRESFHPDLLRDGIDRDRFFDHLWAEVEHLPFLPRLLAAERADLHVGDIPMFSTYPDSRDVYSSRGECIADLLEEPSRDAVRRNIARLSEQDLAHQCWFIEASLTTIAMGDGQARWKGSQLQPVHQKNVSREQLLQAARAVGERLYERALRRENDVAWIGVSLVGERQWMVLPAGFELYSGQSGIAFFLAYLGHITGEEKYTHLAKQVVTSIIDTYLCDEPPRLPIGAFEGYGSFIYLLSHTGMLWNDSILFAAAQQMAKTLPELVAEDTVLDMMAGAAGCIAALQSLCQVAPSKDVLAAAIRCGDHLLAKAQPMPTGGIGWETTAMPTKQPLVGFSHGAAGIALSLLEVAAMSGEQQFQQAALAALEYERSTFSEEKQNWPDFRDQELRGDQEPGYMTTWCHGASGVALGRLAALKYHADATMYKEIEVALQTTLAEGFGTNHSLCHGDLGNLDVLLVASQLLQEGRYQTQVERLSAEILDSIERIGWCTGIPLGVETPGLMTGIAGIGYELLRLAEPDRVPSVLLLAPPIA